MSLKPKILYIDDEQNNLTSFRAVFRRDFKIETALSGDQALQLLKTHNFHIIVTDQRMPEMTGIEFLQIVKKSHPESIRILLTGYADINAVIDAINQGEIYRYISKPWNEQDLKQVLLQAYEVHRLRLENEELTEKLKETNEKLEFLIRQKHIS